MPGGRPGVEITQDVSDEICRRLIGGESLSAICASEGMPSKDRVYFKMAGDEKFRTAIAGAREAQQEAIADDTVDMADAATAEDWQVVKLRIWARQWRAAKLAPKKYGDKVSAELSGPDGAPLEAPSADKSALAILRLLRAADAPPEHKD